MLCKSSLKTNFITTLNYQMFTYSGYTFVIEFPSFQILYHLLIFQVTNTVNKYIHRQFLTGCSTMSKKYPESFYKMKNLIYLQYTFSNVFFKFSKHSKQSFSLMVFNTIFAIIAFYIFNPRKTMFPEWYLNLANNQKSH